MNRLFYFSMNHPPAKGLLRTSYSLSEFELSPFAYYTGFLQGIPVFEAVAWFHTRLLSRYDNWESGGFIDVGISGFHFIEPQQSVFNDLASILPLRWSAQLGYQKQLPSDVVINAKFLFQHQAKVQYLQGGLSVGKIFGERRGLIGVGCWHLSYISQGLKAFLTN